MSARALCWVCFRAERGFGWDPALVRKKGKPRWFCSRGHQEYMAMRSVMMDWSEREEEIIWAGIKAGGEYLDELKKSDLAALSKGELIEFAKCILVTVVEERHNDPSDVELNDDIPF
jgi:hypothetical protein